MNKPATAPITILHPSVQDALKQHGINCEAMECDPELADTAVFCEHYKVSPEQTGNTIIVAIKTQPIKFACCIILATTKLDVNKRVCEIMGVRRSSFASSDQTLELTGMQIGGVTPFGLPTIPILADSAVMEPAMLILGGGNRTSKVLLVPSELSKLPNFQVVTGLAIGR